LGGDGFAINDIPNFTRAIQRTTNELHPLHDVIVDGIEYTDDEIALSDLLGPRTYTFQKPTEHSWQDEWRFFFSPRTAVHGPVDLECPEAIQYCERLN